MTVEGAFGVIDLRWSIFWKRVYCTLENASLVIVGSMHLHNFLVDYRDSQSGSGDNSIDDSISERNIFE